MKLYLRREPAQDGSKNKYDVVAFGDLNGKPDFGNVKGRWPWYNMHKPSRRNKAITLDRVVYNVTWLDHKGK
jgi:hypothetical protein